MTARRRLKDITALSDADRAALESLARAWTDHPWPVLFAGAGLPAFNTKSKPGLSAQALGWQDLAKRWRRDLAHDGVKSMPMDPLRLAQVYEQARGRSRLLDTLEAAVPEDQLQIEPAYRELASISWGAIITTNYDSFLERTFDGTQLRVLRIARDPDLTRRRTIGDIPLIKMHGEFAHRDLIIITEDDYNAYRRTRPGIAAKVDQLLIEHPIFFIGFSLDDPNVSRILNWVRSTVGKLQLPSVSIVHSPPSRPECELWADRGIRLVHCPEKVPLADLLAAFSLERDKPTVDPPMRDDKTQAIIRDLREAVAASPVAGWTAKVVESLRALLERADAGHREEAALGAASVQADDWRPVITSLTHLELTRWMLLVSNERLFHYKKFDHHGSGVAVIPVGLMLFGLISDDDRCDLAVNWVRELADDAAPTLLRSCLRSLRQLRAGELQPAVWVRLNIQIRELAFLLGDEAELRRELAVAPAEEDPFALCRRGADFLLLGEASTAKDWYTRARIRARTGDEMYAALFGLWECSHWSQELHEERERIPEVLRPKSEETWKLLQTAGDQGLDHRSRAVRPLERFVRAARALGWPTSARGSYSGPLEGVAKKLARFEFEAPDQGGARKAIGWLLRFGLFEKGSLSDEQLETLVSRPDDRHVVKDWLDRSFMAPRQRQGHALFTIRCFDVLSDDEIDAAVHTLILEPPGTREAELDARATARWELLAEQAQRMPVETAIQVAARLTHVLSAPGWRATEHLKVIQPWLWPLPVDRWRDRPELRSLVGAILARCRAPTALRDWPERNAILDAISRLARADLLTETDRQAFRTPIENFAERAPSDDDLGPALSALAVLLALGMPRRSLAKRFGTSLAASFEQLKNSTRLENWCWAVRELGPVTDSEVFDDLFEKTIAAAKYVVANREAIDQSPFPFRPAWEIALAIGTLANSADAAGKTRAVAAITSLGEFYAEALPALLKVGQVAPGVLVAAQDRIAQAFYASRGEEEGKAAVQAVVAWCELSAEARTVAPERMWELFVAAVTVNPASADRARGNLGWFAARGLIPEKYHERVAQLVLAGTGVDQPWSVRKRSAVVLRSVAKGTSHQADARRRLFELSKDPVTLLRRIAERALSEMSQRRTSNAGARSAPRRRQVGQ
jgi:hypothetical protein